MSHRPAMTAVLSLALAWVAGAGAQSPPSAAEGTVPAAATHRQAVPVEGQASKDGLTAQWSVPADQVRVGDAIPLRMRIEAPAGTEVRFGDVGPTAGAFDIRDLERASRATAAGVEWTLTFTASTFESGAQELPAFTLTWNDARGAEQTLEVGACALEVESIAGAATPEQFKDIKGPVAMDLGGTAPWLWWVLGGAAAAAAAWWIIRRQRAQARERELTADAWALRELDLLEREDLVGRGEYHAYWVRLSGTIRCYVERRFRIAAPEKTTQEFLAAAREHPEVGAEHRHVLTDFLRAADMVKFAALRPADSDCRRGLAAARDFVRDTTPDAQPAQPKEPLEVGA